MSTRTALAGLALVLLALPGAEEDLAWSPEQGTVLTRSFSEETEWGLTAMDDDTGDSDLPDISGMTRRELEVVDELVALGEGRPALLKRTFESASRTSEIDFEFLDISESYAFSLETALAGATVSFEWDGDAEEWRVESDEVDDQLLELQREDLDLRALLSDDAVSEGDSWEVDFELLVDLLRPAGDLGFTRETLPVGPYAGLNATEVIATSLISASHAADDVWGELRLVWEETREEDGRTLAVIELELEGDLSVDATERIAGLVEDMGADPSRQTELTMDWEVEGTGQLVWDLSAGHFASLELAFEGPAAVEMSWREGGENAYRVQMAVELDIATLLKAEASSE